MRNYVIVDAITGKTRVIVPARACVMDKIMDIAKTYKLFVVEDSAQGGMSKYQGKALNAQLDISVVIASMRPKITPWMKLELY